MGRFTVILVVGFAIVAATMRMTYNRLAADSQNVGTEQYHQSMALHNARSLTQSSLSQLSVNHDWNAGYSSVSFGVGTASATIDDHSTDPSLGDDTVRVTSTGTSGNVNADIIAMVALNALPWPSPVKAGVTANCDITSLGGMIIDGRDHDWDGNLIPNNGVDAVNTTGSYNRSGSSIAGGTMDDGRDIAPDRWLYTNVVEENTIWPTGYPDNPDAVLGLTDGTLKALAQSGVDGGQYVTDPDSLTLPLTGVTYVELPSGGIWRDVDIGAGSEGVLIVHNDDSNALLTNLEYGSFTGLMMIDDFIHIHIDIIGAVFLMTSGPANGNCIGNGTGSILYSAEAVTRSINESHVKGDSLAVFSYYE